MSGNRALLLGATGLTGASLLKQLEADPEISEIIVPARKTFRASSSKTIVREVNFSDPDSLKSAIGEGDYIFSCIGTTMKKVKGDKKEYRKVDYEIPIQTARYGLEKGYRKFMLVSAVGADSRSGTFYLKLKGEVEDDLKKLPFPAIHIFQPSILYGDRNETRLGEDLGKLVIKAVQTLLPEKWSRFKGIHTDELAKAMLAAAHRQEYGTFVYTYNSIQELINR